MSTKPLTLDERATNSVLRLLQALAQARPDLIKTDEFTCAVGACSDAMTAAEFQHWSITVKPLEPDAMTAHAMQVYADALEFNALMRAEHRELQESNRVLSDKLAAVRKELES